MAQTSFALMTNLGRSKEAAALANASKITIEKIAIGDGSTVPSGGETELYNEVDRKTISGNGVVVGATNVAYFDCFLAAEDGPYTIREAGLYDDEGDLIAIAHYDPPISKPIPASGQTVEGTVRLEVAFSDVANITIKVDPSMQVPLQRITRLPWVPVISMSLTAPPASPEVGDTYVVAANATGAWVGQDGKLAEYGAAGWAIIDPPNGHGIGLPDGSHYVRIGGVYILRGKVRRAIESASITFADTNQDQLAEAMARYASAGVFYIGSGTGNAHILTPLDDFVAPTQYFDGMEISFYPATSNTGATTINVAGLGAKPLREMGGNELASGRLDDGMVTARYGAATNDFRLLPWSRGMSPPYILGDLPTGQSMPYETTYKFRYTIVRNTMGATYVDGDFTAPRDGTYLFIYRASFEVGLDYSNVFISTMSNLDAHLAPSSPYGDKPTLWTYTYYFNGTYAVTVPSFAGSCVIDVKEGEVLSLTGKYSDNAGSGSRNLQAGKMAIILLS